jgi:hypothetical protein
VEGLGGVYVYVWEGADELRGWVGRGEEIRGGRKTQSKERKQSKARHRFWDSFLGVLIVLKLSNEEEGRSAATDRPPTAEEN